MALTQVQSGMVQQLASANMPTGSVLQVVQGTNASNTSTTSSSPVSTPLSVSITPKFSTSKILITYHAPVYNTTSGGQIYLYFYRNGSALIGGTRAGDSYSSSGGIVTMSSSSLLDSPSTTSATTYAIYISAGVGTAVIGDSGVNQVITVMEIAG